MVLPLSGVRILDLSQAAAGPFGSMILGDLGAEVIKIEAGTGDVTRTTPGPGHEGESYHFLAFNRNKKSVTLDLATKSGKQAFYDLVKKSDVVWDNFRPGVTERLQIDYETLNKINPKIISCSISGYGESGPYRDRPSWDPIISAISGLTSFIGEPDRPPIWTNIAFVDLISGLYGVIALQAALRCRDQTGEGQKVNVAMLDAALTLLTHRATHYFFSGEIPKRMTGHHASIPFGVFPTKEGDIALGPCWPRIARVLGAEELIDDPRFKEQAGRMKHRDALNARITELLMKEKAEDWLAVMLAEDIPAAVVNNIGQALSDDQVLNNDMILTVEHQGGPVKMVGNPIKIKKCQREKYGAPPKLGENNHEVFSKILGYSEGDIKKLEADYAQHAKELASHLRKTK